jgi:hypothetical protein
MDCAGCYPGSPVRDVNSKYDDRPWFHSLAASSAVHVGVILVASLMVFGPRTPDRTEFVESDWQAADAIEPAATPTLVLESPLDNPGGNGGGDTKPRHGEENVVDLDKLANRHPRMEVRAPVTARPLTSKWLADARSGTGLADVIGPVVYGTAGTANAQGNGGGSGNGTGTGNGDGSSFFGIQTAGKRIVYVVDASSSMNRPYTGEGKTRFGQVKLELAKAVLALQENQQFFIIFFNEHPQPMPSSGLENAFAQNKERYLTWMVSVPAGGLTDPRPAMALALSVNPDVVYLLTDGLFPRGVTGELETLRQHGVQINTIDFGDPRGEKLLKPLALKNGGHFAFVP